MVAQVIPTHLVSVRVRGPAARCGRSSEVEQKVSTLRVVGSTPIVRSNLIKGNVMKDYISDLNEIVKYLKSKFNSVMDYIGDLYADLFPENPFTAVMTGAVIIILLIILSLLF